jgi:hypothetical protein
VIECGRLRAQCATPHQAFTYTITLFLDTSTPVKSSATLGRTSASSNVNHAHDKSSALDLRNANVSRMVGLMWPVAALGHLTALDVSKSGVQLVPCSSILDSMCHTGRVLRQLHVLHVERTAGPTAPRYRVVPNIAVVRRINPRLCKAYHETCPELPGIAGATLQIASRSTLGA